VSSSLTSPPPDFPPVADGDVVRVIRLDSFVHHHGAVDFWGVTLNANVPGCSTKVDGF
jgi:hypothetical protein